MRIIDVGTGPPLLLIPGVQGRWEWMKPAVDALARCCRVITFSLADEPGWGRFDAVRGFDSYVDQITDAMQSAGLRRAVLCGVSYGGLIAAAFAVRHPDMVDGLVLVSAIPPSWKPDRRARFYLRAPRLLSPLFCLGAARLYPEIAAAHAGVLSGGRAALRHGWVAATHMFSPARMARRVQLLDNVNLSAELPGITVPVLIVTGEASLDRVVPTALTEEYVSVWPHARLTVLAGTGHLGLITKPDAFARLLVPFVHRSTDSSDLRRRIG